MSFLACLGLTILFWYIVVLVISLINELSFLSYDEVPTTDKTDNATYKVNEDLHCPECAADQLDEVNKRIKHLIHHLQKKFPNDPRTHRLSTRYNAKNLVETTPNGGKDTSFTLNKGQKISVCVRSSYDKSKIHDINLIMYVMLHELGHLAVDTWGHGGDFPDAFSHLLREGRNAGVWKPVDYSMRPKEYCGITIDRTARH